VGLRVGLHVSTKKIIHDVAGNRTLSSQFNDLNIQGSRESSGSVVTRLRDRRLGFDSRQGQGIFLFAAASRRALGPTQPPMQLVPEALSDVKLNTQL
jgi:hypothetical protein